jgi:hypothetical protein
LAIADCRVAGRVSPENGSYQGRAAKGSYQGMTLVVPIGVRIKSWALLTVAEEKSPPPRQKSRFLAPLGLTT